MASITASIQLYDRVSAPINNMISALDSMCHAFEEIDRRMDDSFDTAPINSARQSIAAAQHQIINLSAGQEDYTERVRESTAQTDALLGKIMSIAGAYVSINKLFELSDTMIQNEARLNLMNNAFNQTAVEAGKVPEELLKTNELVNMVYASAQDARTPFNDMASVIARFGNNAKDAFENQSEVVAFANLIQKQMTIAGASTQESASAILQLSQGLGAGVLRGEELNSIFEQAPNIIQSIADYLDVPIGQIRAMAAEGQLTADVVKNAVFASADEINEKFGQMPMTWGQVWTSVMNELYMASTPVLEIISLMANNWSIIEPIVIGAAAALGLYAGALLVTNTLTAISATTTAVKAAADAMAAGNTFMWTVAQHGLNAALMACPLTWILLAIIAVIAVLYAGVAAMNKFAGTSVSATGIICGVFMTGAAFIGNLFVALVNTVIGLFVELWNFMAMIANFFANVFNNPVAAIARLFASLVDNIIGMLQTLAGAIDTIFGSNLAGALQGWKGKLSSKIEMKYGEGIEVMPELDVSDLMLDRFSYKGAWNTGYNFGAGIDSNVSDMFGGSSGTGYDFSGYDTSQIPSNIADVAGNTGSMADSLEISSEDLKYLRDIAERDVINRFTTAEIRVEMTNNNNISSEMDLDGIVDYLTEGVNEAMEKAAEGVHE